MVEFGKTQREIAEHYGFKDKLVIKKLLQRERRKLLGISKQRDRKPIKTFEEYKYKSKEINDRKQVVAGFSAIHRKEVRPKAKYAVIYRHREAHPISVMCRFLVYPEAVAIITKTKPRSFRFYCNQKIISDTFDSLNLTSIFGGYDPFCAKPSDPKN